MDDRIEDDFTSPFFQIIILFLCAERDVRGENYEVRAQRQKTGRDGINKTGRNELCSRMILWGEGVFDRVSSV